MLCKELGRELVYEKHGDPLIVAVGSDNYRLESDSPCTNSAADLSVTVDTITIEGADYIMDYKWGLDPITIPIGLLPHRQ